MAFLILFGILLLYLVTAGPVEDDGRYHDPEWPEPHSLYECPKPDGLCKGCSRLYWDVMGQGM